MHYVYIIRSVNYPDQVYVGYTSNLKKRLSDHNCGNSTHTEKYVPWKLVVYLGFEDEIKAIEFEKYLKSGSGREFRDKRLINTAKSINKRAFCLADADKFTDFVTKRFGVYLDTMWGFRNNLKKLSDLQRQYMVTFNKSIQELDQSSFFHANGEPPSAIELISEHSLHIRRQGQVKMDNSDVGINRTFAIHNCLSDIYNQWKPIKKNIDIDDDHIPAIAYIRRIRDRTQHELYDDNCSIQANDIIEMQKTLGSYIFPRFHKGDHIILTEQDCNELIREIKLQLFKYFDSSM